MLSTISIHAGATLLMLQLLPIVFATVVTVVLKVTVDCAVALPVAVLVTAIFLLWTHAATLIRDTENVEMTRGLTFCMPLFLFHLLL